MPSTGICRCIELADEQAVVLLAALGHGADRLVHLHAQAARIEVEAMAQNEAVDTVEKRADLRVLAKGGHDDGKPAGGEHGVGITRVEPKMCSSCFAGGMIIDIDPDDRPGWLGHANPSLVNMPSQSRRE